MPDEAGGYICWAAQHWRGLVSLILVRSALLPNLSSLAMAHSTTSGCAAVEKRWTSQSAALAMSFRWGESRICFVNCASPVSATGRSSVFRELLTAMKFDDNPRFTTAPVPDSDRVVEWLYPSPHEVAHHDLCVVALQVLDPDIEVDDEQAGAFSIHSSLQRDRLRTLLRAVASAHESGTPLPLPLVLEEAPVEFSPTYPLDPATHDYLHEGPGKCRRGWPGRVLFGEGARHPGGSVPAACAVAVRLYEAATCAVLGLCRPVVCGLSFRARAVDKPRLAEVYDSVSSILDFEENRDRATLSVAPSSISFSRAHFGVAESPVVVELRNTGRETLTWNTSAFLSSPVLADPGGQGFEPPDQSHRSNPDSDSAGTSAQPLRMSEISPNANGLIRVCPSWGVLRGGESVSVQVLLSSSSCPGLPRPNTPACAGDKGESFVEAVVRFCVDGGGEVLVTLDARFVPSLLGSSLIWLLTPPHLRQHKRLLVSSQATLATCNSASASITDRTMPRVSRPNCRRQWTPSLHCRHGYRTGLPALKSAREAIPRELKALGETLQDTRCQPCKATDLDSLSRRVHAGEPLSSGESRILEALDAGTMLGDALVAQLCQDGVAGDRPTENPGGESREGAAFRSPNEVEAAPVIALMLRFLQGLHQQLSAEIPLGAAQAAAAYVCTVLAWMAGRLPAEDDSRRWREAAVAAFRDALDGIYGHEEDGPGVDDAPSVEDAWQDVICRRAFAISSDPA